MVRSAADVRPSPIAGKWYPGRKDELVSMIDTYLKAAKPSAQQDKILGLLAPHAGLRYSGPVAAHAFSQVRDMVFDTVVVIGPLHRPISGGPILTTAHAAYETPLGTVTIDQDMIEAISKETLLTTVRNDAEHSIEIELPFLQHALKPGFSLVPIMMIDQSEWQVKALSKALSKALQGRRALLVASSDLSHFYPQPIAEQLDRTMLSSVATMNPTTVIKVNEDKIAFACGYGAIATVIDVVNTLSGSDKADIVAYATSGNVTGDFDSVVGYSSATFLQAS